MFLSIVGRRPIPANAAQLWAERHSFTQAFWGFFGGVNVPLPDTIYLIFNVIGGVGLLGGFVFLLYTFAKRQWTLERWMPALVTILWSIITFVSYLRWTMDTPASQGRLIFGALSSILMWIALGLSWWLPQRLRLLTLTGVAGFFAVVAIAAPFTVIAPAYAVSPINPTDEPPITAFQEPAADGTAELIHAEVNTETTQPANYVMLDLAWRVETPLSRDWSIFVHLVTPDDVIVGQRDIYPSNGLLAASDLTANTHWQDRLAVYVPSAAYAPTTLSVEIGWYDLPTGERMTLADGSETFTIGTVELLPRQSDLDVPNPISVNFDNQIELVGYSLSDLSPAAGESVELTLYWRGLREIEQDYVVFAHVINPATLSIYAGSDAQPANWTAPTSTWQPGNIIEDTHTLTINPDTPPGIYELEIGLYIQTPDGFPRLRIVTPDGGMANDYTYLSRVRVLPREDES
ncbi:MAG TPA: hypothetical protein VK003_08695 [Oceanobacillus sp.]|nr:hypothetical protein [Oceanobacillus sp.]